MKTTNVNLTKKEYDVYCGRGQGYYNDPLKCQPKDKGYFGNPIHIGGTCMICNQIHNDGGSTLPCYKEYLMKRIENDSKFRSAFYNLKGMTLGCFCKPKKCHTDIMIEILDSND